MPQKLLSFVDVNPPSAPDAVVIWLHGLGDSGDGFAPIVPQLQLPAEMSLRFVFPHAPVRAITVNNGAEMRAWYDVKSLSFQDRADMTGVLESVAQVEQLLAAEIAKGIPANRIILAGFSQGGVIAYYLGLRYPQQLAGIMCLSTYMCETPETEQQWAATNDSTPIFVAHGSYDNVVPIALGKMAFSALQTRGFHASWREYPMPHSVCPEEIQDISAWIQQCLPQP